MEMTPSQRQRTNKAIADYMLSNGYNEALESFAREADFPDKMDLEAGSGPRFWCKNFGFKNGFEIGFGNGLGFLTLEKVRKWVVCTCHKIKMVS